MKKGQVIYCERCGDKLNPKTAVWLELSLTDSNYYDEIPSGHDSQGGFSFGKACAKKELKETKQKLIVNLTKSASIKNIRNINL